MAYYVADPGGLVESLERLRLMARVLVAPLRIRIMAALSVRPMSPRMFQEEHGGGELSRIDDNFKVLMRYGWIKLIETKTGGELRGGTEHVYRATQLPIFDSNTWPTLPKAMREMYSSWVFGTLAKRIVNALEAGTLDARDDRHFTWTPGLADQLAWDRILDRTDGLFEFVLSEVKKADSRLADSGEQPIRLTVALAAFEAPPDRFDPGQPAEAVSPLPSLYPFSVRMAKALIDSLRILILSELSTRSMSAKSFYEEFGGGEITKSKVYDAFRTLRRFDWLILVTTEGGGKRRGGKENFYRAARPPILDGATWPALSPSLKNVASAKVFDTLSDRIREALKAETMDARSDRHFTWTPGVVDQLGWGRIVGRLDDLFDFAREELKSAEARLAKSGEEPIPMTIALAAFESPPELTRAH